MKQISTISAMSPPRATPIRRLWLAVFSGYLGFGATLQLLPGFVTERFDSGPAAAGWAVGIAFAATAICRPLAGRAGDAGLARVVVLAGGLLIAAGAAGQLMAGSLAVLLAFRLVMGAGEAALFSAALPWVLAGTPAVRRGRVAGWFGLSMWGGLAAGPLLALGADGGGRDASAGWWMVIGLGLLSTVLTASTPRRHAGASWSAIWPGHWREVVPAGAALPGIGFGLSAYGYGTIAAGLVLFFADSGIGGERLALFVFAAGFLVARSVGSPFVDRFGGAIVASVCLAVEAIGLLIIALAHGPAVGLFGDALTGVGVSLMFPAAVAVTLQRTKAAVPGTAVGLMASFWDLGVLVAGVITGQITAFLGFRAAFLLAAGTSLLALGVVRELNRPSLPGDEVEAAESSVAG